MSYVDGIGGPQREASLNAPTTKTAAHEVQATADAASHGAAATSRVAETDHANLSTTGGLIAKALEGSDTREAKVAALQQAIASGTYHVPASAVADKLIQALLDR